MRRLVQFAALAAMALCAPAVAQAGVYPVQIQGGGGFSPILNDPDLISAVGAARAFLNSQTPSPNFASDVAFIQFELEAKAETDVISYRLAPGSTPIEGLEAEIADYNDQNPDAAIASDADFLQYKLTAAAASWRSQLLP